MDSTFDMSPGDFQVNLVPDESLLWMGHPKTGIRFSSSDVSRIISSLAWCGFIFYWEYRIITSDAPVLLAIGGIPFILTCLYIMSGSFIVDALKRSRTSYLLTNQRLLIKSELIRKKTISLLLSNVVDVNLNESEDGSGTISFRIWPGAGLPEPPDMKMVDNARLVYNKIKEALKKK